MLKYTLVQMPFFADIGFMGVWKIEEGVIVINKITLGIKELLFDSNKRDDPTLVFLHDALGCIASWKDFPEQLCKAIGLNGLVYDRQGHGRSEVSTVERTVGYLEKEALEVLPLVLKKLGIKKSNIDWIQ